MINVLLSKEFFKIGLLSFGGGYATIPFLYHIAEKYNWYTLDELTQMIAIASITPGPIGINMATYAGFKTHGLFSALIATTSLVLPAIFIVIAISKILKKYSDNKYIQGIIYGLKPASCALIASVAIKLLFKTLSSKINIIIFAILLFFLLTKKKAPIFYLTLSAILGLLL